MSAYHEIFVHTDKGENDLLADVSAAAGTPLHPVPDEKNKDVSYAGRADHAAIEIEMSHELEEDYGIPLHRYPILITVRDFDSDKTREEELARGLFQQLCRRGGYELLLVFNASRLLDSYPSVRA